MGKFKTVFLFQLKEGLKTKSFKIMSVVLFVLIVGFFGFSHFINKPSNLKVTLINTSTYQVNSDQWNKQANFAQFSQMGKEDINKAKESVKTNKKDALLVIEARDGKPYIEYVYKNTPDYELVQFAEAHLQQQYISQVIAQKQVSPDVAKSLLSKVTIKNVPLRNLHTTGLVYVFVFLMYLFIIMFGQMVAMGVAGEKATRVMEIMITKAKPVVMLYAKIISSMIMGLIQIAIILAGYGVARLLGWTAGKLQIFGMPIDLSVLSAKVFIFFAIFFILGYVLYTLIFAALSSMVSRIEDINSTVGPVTLLVVVAMLIGMKSLSNPNATVVVVSSYIPFFSPIVTFARFVLGEAGPLEMTISLAELLVTIAVISAFATRVYIHGVNRYSGKATFKDAIKLLKR